MHKRTERSPETRYDRCYTAPRGDPVTIFVLLGAVVVALVIWRVLAVTTMADPAPHGRMSERWLAEHRASSQT